MTGLAAMLVAVAAGLTALGIITRYVRKAWRSVTRVHHTIERVAAEFQPNGGGSMRDAINRIEASLGEVTERVTVIENIADRRDSVRERREGDNDAS